MGKNIHQIIKFDIIHQIGLTKSNFCDILKYILKYNIGGLYAVEISVSSG